MVDQLRNAEMARECKGAETVTRDVNLEGLVSTGEEGAERCVDQSVNGSEISEQESERWSERGNEYSHLLDSAMVAARDSMDYNEDERAEVTCLERRMELDGQLDGIVVSIQNLQLLREARN